MLPLEVVRYHAQEEGWQEVQFNDVSRVIGFLLNDWRVNVYYTTGTVGTCINHHRKGKTQLFRPNQEVQELVDIFRNPRVHTGVGYYCRSAWTAREPSASPTGGILAHLATKALTKELYRSYDESTVHLALGTGYFGVTHYGLAWGHLLPCAVYNIFEDRASCDLTHDVDFITLGPDSYFYVSFEDGSRYWDLPPSLEEELCSTNAKVELLAFAPNDGWFVQYDNGGKNWCGIPQGLTNQISGRMNSEGWDAAAATVEDVAIGRNGEWWVRYANGACKFKGLSRSMYAAYNKLVSQGKNVVNMRFGEGYTWAITY